MDPNIHYSPVFQERRAEAEFGKAHWRDESNMMHLILRGTVSRSLIYAEMQPRVDPDPSTPPISLNSAASRPQTTLNVHVRTTKDSERCDRRGCSSASVREL